MVLKCMPKQAFFTQLNGNSVYVEQSPDFKILYILVKEMYWCMYVCFSFFAVCEKMGWRLKMGGECTLGIIVND